MNSKRWCVLSIAAAFCAVLAVVIFNVLTDPFGVFGSEWYSYSETNNPRVAKIEYLKKNHDKYDSYIIGCSSTSSYPVEDLNRYMDARFYNLIMYGADMYDVEQTVYYVGENYEMKNLVVNLYIANGFDYNYEPDRLTGSMHHDVDGSSKLGFYFKYAFANPQYSFAKLKAEKHDRYLSESFDVFLEDSGAYDKRKRDAEHISDLEEYYERYPAFADYPVGDYPLSKFGENAESLMRIREFCEDRGINLIVVNAPIYYDYFKCIPRSDIEKFYETIAQKVDFWDFSVSSVSLEPRYFYDETHFRNDVGRMALARIFGDSSVYVPADFGVHVTADNVSGHVGGFYGKEFSDSGYTKKLPVLLYHHIAEETDANEMIVTPATFEEHMRIVKENGFSSVTVQDVVQYIEQGRDLPQNPILITFDDGYMSNYDYAYPILKKYGLKGTIFAVGSTFGGDTYPGTDEKIFPHFGEKEMHEMEQSGVVEVYSHTYDMHQSEKYQTGTVYGDVLQKKGESDAEYAARVKNDTAMWEKALGKKCTALAFPHGVSDLFSQELLNECGTKLTFSTNPKTDTLIKGLSDSGYNIGRYTVTDSMTGEDLLEILR